MYEQGEFGKVATNQTSAYRTMLLADKFSSSVYMQKSLGILLLEKRRMYHRAVDCHKHIYNEKSSLAKYFKTKGTGRATRSGEKNKKIVPDIRSNMERNAYGFRGQFVEHDTLYIYIYIYLVQGLTIEPYIVD